MPGGDGTGPMSMGPMTGRGMGYCAGYAMPGYAVPGYAKPGYAMPGYANAGFGMGCGRGFRRMYCQTGMPVWARCEAYGVVPYAYPAKTPEVDEKEALRNQVGFLEKQLEEMRERLKGFEEAE